MKAINYLAFTANAAQSRLVYRNQVWASWFGDLVQVMARIAIWTSVYAGASSVDGITLPDMITYALIAGTVLSWDYSNLLNDVGKAVTTGDVTVYLLKPLHYPLYLLASQLGNFLFEVVVIVLPVVVVVVVFFGVLPPASAGHGALFLAYWALSFLTIFTIATLCGLLAFWLMTVKSLEWFLIGILALFSGGVVPLWFFPPWLAAIAGYLPFAWIGYYPTAVYLGKLDIPSALLHLGVGIGWLLLLALGVSALWARARNRLIVQGG